MFLISRNFELVSLSGPGQPGLFLFVLMLQANIGWGMNFGALKPRPIIKLYLNAVKTNHFEI